METSHVCVIDAEGRKVAAEGVDSTPEAIATLLERHGPVERVVIETGRMTRRGSRGACTRWASRSCASMHGRRTKA